MMAVRKQTGFNGQLRLNEPMSSHTSWRVGGCAKSYYKPLDKEDLSLFLQSLPEDEHIIFLGLGSNVLVRDDGIDGTVIATQGMLDAFELIDEQCIYAESGVTCAKLAKSASASKLSGAEFFAGIPGTVGGAVAMNAGAFGSETWEFVKQVETIDRSGKINVRQPCEFKIAYRSVEGMSQEWFISSLFQFSLQPDYGIDHRASIRKLLDKRNQSQPIGVYSCGSVFKNPDNDYAARLIEAAGLKGLRHGGAHVSHKHANFIINDQQATASDIESLIVDIQQRVADKFGVELQTEVKILGEKK